jgi:hypothetical protein
LVELELDAGFGAEVVGPVELELELDAGTAGNPDPKLSFTRISGLSLIFPAIPMTCFRVRKCKYEHSLPLLQPGPWPQQ